MVHKNYYVYVYYDEHHIPYYVGKGQKNRAKSPRKGIVVPLEDQIYTRYFQEEEQAFALERMLIAFWGRRGYETNGLLLNQTLGGPGSFGVINSVETRRKKSLAKIGKKNPMYGKCLSAESRQKISASKKGSKNPMYGKPVSDETRLKRSQSMKTYWSRRKSSCQPTIDNSPGQIIDVRCY